MVVAPQVSVVVPAYSIRYYIEQALVSLAGQSFRELEVIIVDDSSTDGTAEVVRPFKERDSRFQLLHKPNRDLSSERNSGIRQARAQYIALRDGDEAYEPDKLVTHVALLDRTPDVEPVYYTLDVLS